MQIEQSSSHADRRLLQKDEFLQILFEHDNLNQNEQQLGSQIVNELNEFIKIDRQNIDKGYMSQGQQKIHTHHPNRRKNTIIRKIKIKQRKRKTRQTKIYIQMLQNRVLQLQKSLETATKLNQMNKQYLKKLSQGEHIMNGLFVSKQRHIQNLQFLLKQKQINNQALKKQYCNMRFRQGVFGKDRTKAINYYFSQMSEMFFSDTLKYLIKTAQNQQDFFNPELLKNGFFSHKVTTLQNNINNSLSSNSLQNDDFVSSMNLPNQSISQLSYLKQQILSQKKVLDRQFQKFYQTKCNIMKIARKLQMIIDSMQRYSNHQQISKLIVLADQYRFKKGISVKGFHKQVFDKLTKEKYQYDPNNLFGKVQID